MVLHAAVLGVSEQPSNHLHSISMRFVVSVSRPIDAPVALGVGSCFATLDLTIQEYGLLRFILFWRVQH